MENQGRVRNDVKLSYTLPKPSKNARLFVLCLRVMYMIVLEAAKHATVTYNLGNLADWLSAIATLAAVFVSLYLANRRPRPFLVIKSAYFPEEKDQIMQNGALLKGMKENITVLIQNENDYPVAMVVKNHRKILKPVLGVNENVLYIAGGNSKVKSRSMRIENFDNLAWKKFKIRDIYSNSVYKFRFVKVGNKWTILYPLRPGNFIDVIRIISRR